MIPHLSGGRQTHKKPHPNGHTILTILSHGSYFIRFCFLMEGCDRKVLNNEYSHKFAHPNRGCQTDLKTNQSMIILELTRYFTFKILLIIKKLSYGKPKEWCIFYYFKINLRQTWTKKIWLYRRIFDNSILFLFVKWKNMKYYIFWNFLSHSTPTEIFLR